MAVEEELGLCIGSKKLNKGVNKMVITEQHFRDMCIEHGGDPDDYKRFDKLGVWMFQDGRIIHQQEEN